MSFHVVGDTTTKRSAEMLVTRAGGGVLAPPSSATITILPLSRGQPAVGPSHLSVTSLRYIFDRGMKGAKLEGSAFARLGTGLYRYRAIVGDGGLFGCEVGDVGGEDVEVELRGREAEEGEMGMNPATDRMDNLKRKLVNEGERETKRQLTAPEATD
nr:hypothetical protein I308_00591 [Cryptococcus tetragattii IND107]